MSPSATGKRVCDWRNGLHFTVGWLLRRVIVDDDDDDDDVFPISFEAANWHTF